MKVRLTTTTTRYPDDTASVKKKKSIIIPSESPLLSVVIHVALRRNSRSGFRICDQEMIPEKYPFLSPGFPSSLDPPFNIIKLSTRQGSLLQYDRETITNLVVNILKIDE
jgi:hypothetical protein